MRADFMEEIVRYLGIDTRTQLLAERVWQLLEEPSGEIVDSFYRNTRRSAVGATLDEPTIERLKTKQIEHWRSLFNSHHQCRPSQPMRKFCKPMICETSA